MTVGYNDFAKYWADQGGANAAAEGWGAADPNAELRRRFSIPDSIPDSVIQQYYQKNGLPDPISSGGFGQQMMDFAGPGSPLAWVASMAYGGPVAGTISAANGSGATQSMGVDPRLTTTAALAYGAANSGGAGSGPPPSSDGGAMDMGQGMDGMYDYQSPQNANFWNNTYATNNTGTMTDAIPAGSNGMDDWWSELGLTAQDVGMSADPWTASPSTADLGGNIGSSGGLTDFLSQAGPDALKFIGKNPGLIGALLGGVLGSRASPRPAGTTTTTQDLPEWLKPYVMGNLNAAGGAQASLLNSPSVSGAAVPEYLKTVRGDYLNPSSNPYLDATYKHAAGLVDAGIDSRFESAGRYGSGAHQSVLQEGNNNLATNIFGGNYQAERARQVAAVGGAPTFDTQRSAAAFSPYSDYKSLFPGSTATTTPYFTNPLGGILSGGLAGGMLSRMMV